MAGYTRQDTANNIANGNVIDANDLDSEFNQVESAFSSSTGHKHDGTAAEGPRLTAFGQAGELDGSTANVLKPKTDGTVDLGASDTEFKDAYFDGTVKTDTLTVDETSTLTGNVTASANVSVGGTLTVTGDSTLNGNVDLGNAASDTVTVTGQVDSSVIPSADDTYDLGSSTKEWRNLYVDGTAEIDTLNAGTVDIDGGSIDGATIGANTSAAITGTTITASSGFTGDLTGGASEINISANTSTDTTAYPVLVGASTTGNQAPLIDNADLSYNASTGTLSATKFSGDGSALTGIGGGLYGVVPARNLTRTTLLAADLNIASDITTLSENNIGYSSTKDRWLCGFFQYDADNDGYSSRMQWTIDGGWISLVYSDVTSTVSMGDRESFGFPLESLVGSYDLSSGLVSSYSDGPSSYKMLMQESDKDGTDVNVLDNTATRAASETFNGQHGVKFVAYVEAGGYLKLKLGRTQALTMESISFKYLTMDLN